MTLYKNQPTMGEIDIELRRQGFIPHCFAAEKIAAGASLVQVYSGLIYRGPSLVCEICETLA